MHLAINGVKGKIFLNEINSGEYSGTYTIKRRDRGKTAAHITGAVGGAYAGYVIEGKVRKAYHYEVLVRLQNGTTQTVSYATAPDFRVGDAVKINDGVLVRNI